MSELGKLLRDRRWNPHKPVPLAEQVQPPDDGEARERGGVTDDVHE
jgi:hypothetical protein